MFGLFIQSCSEDESIVPDEFGTSARNGRGGNGGGGNGGGGNGNGGGPVNNVGIPVNTLDSNVVEEWTDLLLVIEQYAGGMRPNASARAMAYIYMAAYETAVPGMINYTSNTGRLDGLNIDTPQDGVTIDWELALNETFADVIDHFLINVPDEYNRQIQIKENQQLSVLSRNVDQNTVDDSRDWGSYVANQIIQYSQTDIDAEKQITEPQPLSYEPDTGDGYWTYSDNPERALFPYWESVRTFAIAPDETTSVEPIAYSNVPGTPYFRQMEEVVRVNNRAKATQNDQLHIAEFWSDDVEGLMISPPVRQISIANQLLDRRDLNLEEALILMLKLGFSLNDAAVATWKYKYEYMVMRPSNFIHDYIDADFQTNLYRLIYWPNPSFPGYPSGHSCFASAAAGIFIDAFGDNINFTDRTHQGRTEFLGSPRTFKSFTEMADENGYSRIPLGVHIRMDCTEGLRLGYEIAKAVTRVEL